MPITIENVMKVGDINHHDLSPRTTAFILSLTPDYKDSDDVMNENLYSVEDTVSEVEERSENLSEKVKEEIAVIVKLCNKRQCSYFRII